MFESDDWIFDVDLNCVEKESYIQAQNDERISSVKRRKVDDCNVSSIPVTKTLHLKCNTSVHTKKDNIPCSSKSSASRENLLLGIFQKDACQNKCDVTKDVKRNPLCLEKVQRSQSSKNNALNAFQNKESRNVNYNKTANNVKVSKEVKLVRIFPGPAGLVPNVKNDILASSYLNKINEEEKKIINEQKTIVTNLSKSQDTKNLIDEGAWKLLLKDLPNNFLEEYGISAIKNKANVNHCYNMKVKFMAGILDYIDYNHDDPFIVLKDSTGSIEGTVHRDIPLNYPGILEPNVVILLHNVGLLKTTTYAVTNKYHILISRVNILAIYSNKERIVTMSHMKDVLSNISNIETNADYYRMPIMKDFMASNNFNNSQTNDGNISLQAISNNNPIVISINNSSIHQSNLENHKDNENCINVDKLFGFPKHSINMNDNIHDVFFTTDCEFFNTSRDQNCLDSSFPSISSQIQRCELSNIRKQSQVNSDNKLNEQQLPQALQKCVMDVEIQENASLTTSLGIDHCPKSKIFADQSTTLHENSIPFYEKTKCVAHVIHKDSKLSVKCTAPVIKSNVKNSKSLVNYFTHNEYDSDDEILSQLDMDNVVYSNSK